MNRSSSRIAAALALALVGAFATNANAIPLEKQWEFRLSGSGSNDTDFAAGGFNVDATLGYHFTDQLELVGRQSFGYSDFGDSSWSGGTRLGGYYNFNFDEDQKIVPYAGVNLGYIYGDAVADTFVAGPEAGLKWFVNDTTFVYGSVSYEFFFDKANDIDSNFSDGQFVYGLGIGFKF
jgi:hypothetical protein